MHLDGGIVYFIRLFLLWNLAFINKPIRYPQCKVEILVICQLTFIGQHIITIEQYYVLDGIMEQNSDPIIHYYNHLFINYLTYGIKYNICNIIILWHKI